MGDRRHGTQGCRDGSARCDGEGLAPIRAESFRAQGDASARMAELTKASVWERTQVMEKSGFASLPGSKTGEPDLARACVELLMAPVAPKI